MAQRESVLALKKRLTVDGRCPGKTKKRFPSELGTRRYQKPTEEGGGYGGVIFSMANWGTYSGAMRVALIVPILTN